MPFARHYRLTLSGVFKPGQTVLERFTFGVNLDPDPSKPNALDAGTFAGYVSDSTAFFSRAATAISPVANLTQVKCAVINELGHYERDPFVADVNVGGAGFPGSVYYPTSTALVVSLGTDRRGPTGRGRIYLPLPAMPLDPSTWTIGAAAAEGVRNSVATWLSDLNNLAGLDTRKDPVCIASRKGYNSVVKTVRVGRVLDVMRSRREGIGEAYTATAAVANT
jgi:hypothetical protein